MTAAKSTYRRRRKSAADSVPADLADWFAGNREPGPAKSLVPWTALIYPDYPLLSERWCAWSADNPGVPPPAGWEWLAEPTSTRHSPPHLVALAKSLIRRVR